jgi:hypothetical protein
MKLLRLRWHQVTSPSRIRVHGLVHLLFSIHIHAPVIMGDSGHEVFSLEVFLGLGNLGD